MSSEKCPITTARVVDENFFSVPDAVINKKPNRYLDSAADCKMQRGNQTMYNRQERGGSIESILKNIISTLILFFDFAGVGGGLLYWQLD